MTRVPFVRRGGFTLIELLLVLGIIMVLTSFIFAAFFPARGKSRQSVCTSNMHQWGQAFAMYIQDYDGTDPVLGVPMSHAQLGLPPYDQITPFCEMYKIWNTPLIKCPNDHRRKTPETPYIAMISYQIPGLVSENFFPDLHLSAIAAERGMEYPLLGCDQHNTDVNFALQPTWATKQVLVLRINQSVKMKTIPASSISSLSW